MGGFTKVPARFIHSSRFVKGQGHPPVAAGSGDGVVGDITVADDFAARTGEFKRRKA